MHSLFYPTHLQFGFVGGLALHQGHEEEKCGNGPRIVDDLFHERLLDRGAQVLLGEPSIGQPHPHEHGGPDDAAAPEGEPQAAHVVIVGEALALDGLLDQGAGGPQGGIGNNAAQNWIFAE